MTSADLSADYAKTQKLSADGKSIITEKLYLFLSADEKELQSGALYRPIRRPTVGGVNVIAIYNARTMYIMSKMDIFVAIYYREFFFLAKINVCGTVSSMLSGLKTRSLGLNTLGTT